MTLTDPAVETLAYDLEPLDAAPWGPPRSDDIDDNDIVKGDTGVDDDIAVSDPGFSTGLPPLSPRMQLARAIAVMVFALSTALLLQVIVLSHFQQRASQEQVFNEMRSQLAIGTAPRGPLTPPDPESGERQLLVVGDPVALLEIPAIGLDQVVVEGTTPSALYVGPGHRRDTQLPGQSGLSVLFGRRAAYGAPFAHIANLVEGDEITVTTGQGTFVYTVLGVRRAGDPVPERQEPGSSRLTLISADGSRFVPQGVVRVDADLAAEFAVVGEPRIIAPSGLPSEEAAMAGDTRTLWALALWMQALMLVSVGVVWSWHRWGRAKTWIVFLAPSLLVALGAAGEVVRLLPNLM